MELNSCENQSFWHWKFQYAQAQLIVVLSFHQVEVTIYHFVCCGSVELLLLLLYYNSCNYLGESSN